MASDVDLQAMSAPTRRLEGYPTFAAFIAKDKDAAIYRRFETLSARNLLYLQSELHDLEGQLEELDRKDAKDIDDLNAQRAAREWTHYKKDLNEQARRRRNLQKIIRKTIKEYRMCLSERRPVFVSNDRGIDEAMVLESQILSLNSPSSRTLRIFKRWFKPSVKPALWGRDEHLFENENDLVALAPVDTDRLNLFLKSYFAWFFKVRKSPFSSHLISRDAPSSKHHSQQPDEEISSADS